MNCYIRVFSLRFIAIIVQTTNELSKHHMISELVVAFYNICPNPYTNNIVQHINAL